MYLKPFTLRNFSVEEYISKGKDSDIVDPDPEKVYTKRKLSRQQAVSCQAALTSQALPPSSGADQLIARSVQYPEHGWGTSLKNLPHFTRAEINEHIKNSGKRYGSGSHHSVPTSWRKGKTFRDDEYLKQIETFSGEQYFYFRCRCYHSFRKNDEPHSLKLALALTSGEVIHSVCSCVAGKTGYCNHSLALMLKVSKYSLFQCKSTLDLRDENDENPDMACTSRLQRWHKRGRGETIVAQPAMDIIAKKTKLEETEQESDGVKCLLHEARNNVQVDIQEEKSFKEAIKAINSRMGLAQILNMNAELTETKFGKSPVGSFCSYQLTHTESNFDVDINIDAIPRNDSSAAELPVYPPFPLSDVGENETKDLDGNKEELINALTCNENEIKTIEIETRGQANSDLWKSERKYRFTASNFHVISHRQRNHDTFAKAQMYPKEFRSAATSHGTKYEPVALHEYMRYMDGRHTPVSVYKCGLVVSMKEPVLGCTPDSKVTDPGCSQPFGIAEVKCPHSKFLVTPKDACSDPNFCCTYTEGHCKLKTSHPYYSQVQGQMGITGAKWCDFIVYTQKGMSIQRIPFNQEFWWDLERKLSSYHYEHFIDFAVEDFQQNKNYWTPCFKRQSF